MKKNRAKWCTERKYPYKKFKQICDEIKCDRLGDFDATPCNYEQCVLNNLHLGAFVANVNADNWQFFQYGILETCDDQNLNHSVLIVGTDGEEYVTARNSWGSDWGEKGTIRLSINPLNNT